MYSKRYKGILNPKISLVGDVIVYIKHLEGTAGFVRAGADAKSYSIS
ncbi:MAG: hypothetical protein WBE68_16945 [Candidatus Nitrosopolaris sp.]